MFARVTGLKKMQRRAGVLFAIPAIVGLVVWIIGPIIASFILSFTDYDLVKLNFVGLANYKKMFFGDNLFWQSLKVTLYYTAGRVPATLIVALAIAFLLKFEAKGRSFFRTIFYVPSVVPIIVSSILWLWLFSPEFGLLNIFLRSLGLPGLKWIHTPEQVVPSLILMATWLAIGQPMVIFLAALQGVPQRFYDAVEVDGGNWWHKFSHITIPMISPVILFNFIMQMIFSFQIFVEVFAMTKGGPVNASLVYVFYMYRRAFEFLEMGYSSALAWMLFLVVALVALLTFKFTRRWIYYEV